MKIWTLLLLFAFANPGYAYYSTIDTAELVPEGQFAANVESQFITSDDSGVNLNGRFDYGLNEASSLRGLIGFGTTDFQVGGFYKWVPIPDLENQPAIGVMVGAMFARFEEGGEDFNEFSVRVHPLVSKKFEVEFGRLTPYASLPFGIRAYDGESDFPVQLEFGSEMRFNELPKFAFFAELGFDINEAFSYASLAVSYDIDALGGSDY